MARQPSQLAADPGKLCKYCGNALPPKAIYCKKCSKFQTWKDTFFNSVSGATLVSLLPILALCWAFLHDRVLFPYSDISISVVTCSLDHIEVAVSNTGSRPGVLGRGQLKQVIGNDVKAERVLAVAAPQATAQSNGGSPSTQAPSSSILVSPSQSMVVRMNLIRKNWPNRCLTA